MTFSKVSAEKVEAIYNKEAIGLDFPSLASSAKAPSTEVGVMVLSFSTIYRGQLRRMVLILIFLRNQHDLILWQELIRLIWRLRYLISCSFKKL